MTPSFAQLLQEAQPAKQPVGTPRQRKTRTMRMERARAHQLKMDMRAAMIAREYMRNGGKIGDAYQAVTHFSPGTRSMEALLGTGLQKFLDEIALGMKRAGIDKDEFAQMLHAQSFMSALDFVDNEGFTLSISELKRLPPHIRAAITKVEQKITPRALVDPTTGQVFVDDNGNPYYVNERYTKVWIADKERARDLLANMMKWTGPNTLVDNRKVVNNYATVVRQADTRTSRIQKTFEPPQLEHEAASPT